VGCQSGDPRRPLALGRAEEEEHVAVEAQREPQGERFEGFVRPELRRRMRRSSWR
jgi:hypothetical protein